MNIAMEGLSTAENIYNAYNISNILDITNCNTYLPIHNTHINHIKLCTVLWSQQYNILDNIAVYISSISNPVSLFTFILPFIYNYISSTLGINILFILSISDCLNAMLKWPIAGDRPYWFSHYVREFSSTCESSYGFPSGHAMVNTAFITTIIYYYKYKHINKTVYNMLLIISYIVIPLICWSRIHIGAHFIEQLVLGVLFGYLLAYYIHKYNILQTIEQYIHNYVIRQHSSDNSSNKSLLNIATISLLSSLSIIILASIELYILSLFNINPLDSIELMQQGCGNYKVANKYNILPYNIQQRLLNHSIQQQQENAHTTHSTDFTGISTPVMSVVRDSGIICALIFYISIQLYRYNKNNNISDVINIQQQQYKAIFNQSTSTLKPTMQSLLLCTVLVYTCVTLTTLCTQLITSLLVHTSIYMTVVYIVNYIQFMFITLYDIVIIPAIIKRALKQ